MVMLDCLIVGNELKSIKKDIINKSNGIFLYITLKFIDLIQKRIFNTSNYQLNTD